MNNLKLEKHLNEILTPENYNDFCPNGLQIEGRKEINNIVTGVTCNMDLIDAAIEQDADAIIVHHGLFWKGDDPVLTGIKGDRIRKLIKHDINLYAYHLPLDGHHQIGNNVRLANILGANSVNIDFSHKYYITFEYENSVLLNYIISKLVVNLGLQSGKALKIVNSSGKKHINKVALCTGSAHTLYDEVQKRGDIDLFITGEYSLITCEIARESETVFIAAGHHNTEIGGVKALSDMLSLQTDMKCSFINIPSEA